MELEKTSEEFQQVATRFERSVGRRVTIVKIERIQNNQLWQAYQAHRQETLRETPSGTPAERTLYHGCPINNVDGINRNGFVTNFAGRANGECEHTHTLLMLACTRHTHIHTQQKCHTVKHAGRQFILSTYRIEARASISLNRFLTQPLFEPGFYLSLASIRALASIKIYTK